MGLCSVGESDPTTDVLNQKLSYKRQGYARRCLPICRFTRILPSHTGTPMDGTQKLVIFEREAGQVEVRLEGETVWLTQRQMSELFDTYPENVLMHLKNVYDSEELTETATTKDFLVIRTEGKRQVKRSLGHYSLDAIISVGYRVNSTRATCFRQWATGVLKEHLTTGYTLNRQRFEQNAAELEAALPPVKKAAADDALSTRRSAPLAGRSSVIQSAFQATCSR